MKKVKHLDYIQDIIKRLNQNSFMIKGWSVTIISALFVFADKDVSSDFFIFSLIPCISFWIVDGFFISTERKYVCLYSDVIKKNEDEIDFSLDTKKYNSIKRNSWLCSTFSRTLIPFYGFIVIGIISIQFIMKG